MVYLLIMTNLADPSFHRYLRLCCSLTLLPALISCNESSSGAADNLTNMNLPVPELVSRVIDPSNQIVVATINGVELEMENLGDIYVGSTIVQVGLIPVIAVTWYDNSDRVKLPIAVYSYSPESPILEDLNLQIGEDDYRQDGLDLDADADGVANLVELREDSDPFDINSPENSVQLNITLAPPNEPIEIDGRYDNLSNGFPVWDTAARLMSSGQPLDITNLIVGEGSEERLSGNTDEHQWLALHDGVSLYLYVLGERSADLPFFDSVNPQDDDSLNIFIDADNSKGQTYDGMNDYHIVIPLLTRSGLDNGTGVSGMRLQAGTNSADLPLDAIEFSTCSCESSDIIERTWEVKLDLAAFGLTVDQPFGLEFQLDEDNDGGARDARWAWALHFARADGDARYTETNPSTMATVKLASTEGEGEPSGDNMNTPQTTTMQDIKVSASSDDAEEQISGQTITRSPDLNLVRSSEGNQTVGLRFNGLDISNSAVVTAAYIQFTAADTRSEPTNLVIRGEAADSALTFDNTDFNITPLPVTVASVDWPVSAWAAIGDAGTDQRTSDIALLIQEIINRPGWHSGNSLAILITGTGNREAESFDGNSDAAAVLHIEYATEPM